MENEPGIWMKCLFRKHLGHWTVMARLKAWRAIRGKFSITA